MSGRNRTTFNFGLTASVLFFCATAAAQATIRFDLPAQPLAESLKAIGSQSNTNLIVSPSVVDGRQAPALKAELTVDQALTQLLAGTGIQHKFLSDKTVVITAEKSASASPSAAPATSPPANATARDTTDTKGDQKPSFWERFRLAQVARESSVNASSTASSNSDDNKPVTLEEVIVTAQKRRERLIDAPQSVSVLTADTLSRLGATQFRDFANTVPGLSFTTAGPGFTQVSLRGVTAGQDVSATVGIYVDDVPYGSSSGFAQGGQVALDVGLFDVDHIEVLRGPQGTLYGASTMGGLIKYVSKAPSLNDFRVDARTGVSNTQHGDFNYNGAIAVNAPLVADKAGLRASAYYSHDGGYIDNTALNQRDVNESDVYGSRFDLLFTPIEQLSVRLGVFLQNLSRDGQGTADFSPATNSPEQDELDQFRPTAEPLDQRFRLVNATIGYDFADATLTSISSYQTFRNENVVDTSREFGGFFPQYSAIGIPQRLSTDKFAQEVRLASHEGGEKSLEWLIGAFYTRETSGNEQEFVLRDLAGNPAQNDLYHFSSPSHYEEYAGFADLTYRLTPKFDVSGGIRYAQNRQSFKQIGSGIIGSFDTRRSGEEVSTYLANARYHFDEHSTGYLRFATGYRPGGPNFVANDLVTGEPLAAPTYEADRLKSYEAGYRMESQDRRFGVDAAAFYIDWSNIQILATRGAFSVYANAPGGATVRGAELSFTARPVNDLRLLTALSYQDAKLSEADPDLGGAKGERLPNVPRVTATFDADYGFSMAGFNPTIGTTVRYVSDKTATFSNGPRPQYDVPSYTVVDLRASITVGTVEWQLYVHNLLDEAGELSASVLHLPAAQVSLLQPRTIGVSAAFSF
jgi:outer membrane receptor protein involved in Fe transport